MPAENLEFEGTYAVNSYRLTVYLNEDIYMDEELDYGTKIDIPEPETDEGFEFNGWEEEIPETMPAHDVVIHGTISGSSAIDALRLNENEAVTVYGLNGELLYENVKINEVRAWLTPGLYVINGMKVIVK